MIESAGSYVILTSLTYTWHVWTWDSVAFGAWTAPNWEWSFTVDLHLGAEQAAPYDGIGPVQVNLVSGNALVGAGSPAGLSYAYNSSTPLVTGAAVGSYYNDVNNNDLFDDPVVMERRDPTIGFDWANGGPGGGVWADNFLVRWTADVSVPVAGSYKFFASSDDAMSIWVRKGTGPEVQVLNRWGLGADVQGTYASAVTANAGEILSLRVDYMEFEAAAFAHVWIEGPYGASGATKLAPLDPSWLAADTPPLPVGWTLSPGLAYASARVVDDQVILTDSSGAPHVYAGRAGGYVPPPGQDGVLGLDIRGALTLQAADGTTYGFDAGGRVASAATPTDDLAASNLIFRYASDGGKGSRLVKIIDPVSAREMNLHYQSFDEDGNPAVADPDPHSITECPVLATFGSPPPYALCRIDYWDPAGSVKTVLCYKSGQLAQIEDPGAVASPVTATAAATPAMTNFGYFEGRMSTVRSPLAHDAAAAFAITGVPDDDDANTVIAYSAGKVSSVALPVPNSGAPIELARTIHRYGYGSGTSSVTVDGLGGTNRSVVFDARGRTTSETQRTGPSTPDLTTTLVWDDADNLVSMTDANGRRTVTTYDGDATRALPTSRPTESFGPAPATCFSGLTPTCPTTMPHVLTTYDSDGIGAGTAWSGLAATYWDTRMLAGGTLDPPWPSDVRDGPAAHRLVDLNGGSPLGTLPAGLSANNWSARYTGELTVASAGAYGFALTLSGGGQLFVDDVLVIDATGNLPSRVVNSPASPSLGAGRHRIRLDYEAPTSGSATLALSWTPPGGSSVAVPASAVAPRYSMATATTVDDRPSQTTRVSGMVFGSASGPFIPKAAGLVTSAISDLGGAGELSSQMQYVDPANLLRPSASYQPGAGPATAGSGTGFVWWAPADDSAGCAGTPSVAQAGALKSITQPDQLGGSARTESYAYDWAGRTVKTTIGGDSACLTYDGRGRLLTATYPAHTNTNVTPNVTEPARTVTYDYAVGGSGSVLADAQDEDGGDTVVQDG